MEAWIKTLEKIKIPKSGIIAYRIIAEVLNKGGAITSINIEITNVAGTVRVSSTAMTQFGSEDNYYFDYNVNEAVAVSEEQIIKVTVNDGVTTVYTRETIELFHGEPVIEMMSAFPAAINMFAGQQSSINLNAWIYDKSGNYELGTSNITAAGTYLLVRVRGGDIDIIDTGTPSIQAVLNSVKVYFPVDFLNNTFLPGDVIQIQLYGIEVTAGDRTVELPVLEAFTPVIGENVAAQGKIQAGSTTTQIVSDIEAIDDMFNNMQILVEQDNASLPDYFVARNIVSYVAATKTFTLDRALPFTPQADNIVLVKTLTESAMNNNDLLRLIGLNHENVYVENTFDGNGNHSGSTIELYDSKTNAQTHDGVTGLLATYTLTATIVDDKPTNYTMVKD